LQYGRHHPATLSEKELKRRISRQTSFNEILKKLGLEIDDDFIKQTCLDYQKTGGIDYTSSATMRQIYLKIRRRFRLLLL
jgi:hypothetical protein